MFTKYSFLNKYSVKYIYTNVVCFDERTGGIPLGRIVELCGDSDVGKTNLMYDIIEKIDSDYIVAYISTSGNGLGYLRSRGLNEKKNLVVCLSNQENEILDFINQTIQYVDLFIVDSMTNILTENEKEAFDINVNQNMPELLSKMNTLLYGEDTALIAVNSLTYKDGILVSRWRNMFQKYCTVRIRLHEYGIHYFNMETITHRLKPELVGGKDNYDESKAI